MTAEAETRDDGGPAFPSVCMNDPGHPASRPGMSLRQWFAGKALAALVGKVMLGAGEGETNAEAIAREAFAQADAMLKASVIVADPNVERLWEALEAIRVRTSVGLYEHNGEPDAEWYRDALAEIRDIARGHLATRASRTEG